MRSSHPGNSTAPELDPGDAEGSDGSPVKPPMFHGGQLPPVPLLIDTPATDSAEIQRDTRYLRSLAEQSLDILSVLDATGTILFESPAIERWTGWKPEELVGRNAFELIHPADANRVTARFKKGLLQPGSIEIIAYRFKHKNGSWRTLESWGRNLLTDQSVHGIIVNSRDVTDRQQEEQRYRVLVDHLPVALIVHQDRKLVFANPAAVQLFAANSIDDLIGRDVLELAAPENRALIARRIEKVKRGQQSSWLEQRIVRLDNTLADVEGTSLVSTHNGRPAIQTILRDISDRKRAEARQAVQYAATRVLAQWNQQDTLEQFLRIVCDGLDWRMAEVWQVDGGAHSLRLTTVVHPNDSRSKAFAEAGRARVFRSGEGLPGRVWFSRQAIWIDDITRERSFLRRELAAAAGLRSTVAVPIFVRDQFAGLLHFFSSARRERDAELLELLKVLATQVGQFLERRQIEQQLFQAQKMEAVGQLAGGVAHDFNNILTIITGHAQLALTIGVVSPELREELGEICTAVDRAAGLTRQLLTFSRKQVMQKRPVQLDAVVNNLAKMLRRIIGEHVTLTIDNPPGLPPLDGDVGMIEQILMNLVVNARDALPEGGDLAIRTRAITFDSNDARRMPQGRAGQFVRLEVSDNGCGMTPEVLARAFEPFFTTKPQGRGTGLGLATVYGIVQQHDGWIQADSHVNLGTTFRVFFPAAPSAEAAAIPAPAGDRALTGHNELLLLVEDEASLRGLARRLLERSGYRILEAASGHEALQTWQKYRSEIDLVLTDMVMPGGMTGRQLVDQIRSESPSLRVIFTSGYTSELNDEEIVRDKIKFLPKPYSPPQLLQIVSDTLRAAV